MAEEGGEDEEVSLKPFRIVEPRVRQLANTVVPRSLVALQQHQENIARHLAERDWDRVNTEQINAARTAQQLKDHLRTLQELREVVTTAEVGQFDSRVADVEGQLWRALRSYGVSSLVSHSNGETTAGVTGEQGGRGQSHLQCLDDGIGKRDDMASSQYEILPSTVAGHSSTNIHTQESWEQLKTELDELREIMTTLTTEVQSHRSKVTHLNDQLDTATLDVREGQTTLAGVSWEIVTGRKYRNLVGIVQHVQQILWCVLKPEKAHKDTSA